MPPTPRASNLPRISSSSAAAAAATAAAAAVVTRSSEEKKSFFARLYSCDSDEEEDKLPQADIDLAKKFKQARAFPELSKPHLVHRQTAPSSTTVSSSARTASPPRTIGHLVRADTAPESGKMPPRGPPISSGSSMRGPPAKKRKLGKGVEVLPEAKQIFRGLKFYFFRNDEKHPSRKMRWDSCRKYGAEISLELNDAVTHIIIDNDLTYPEVLKHLKITSFPSQAVIVSQNYTPECIQQNRVVDAMQYSMLFPVKGYPPPEKSAEASSDSPSSSAEQSSVGSLKVRARPDTVMVPETPFASQRGSSDSSRRVAASRHPRSRSPDSANGDGSCDEQDNNVPSVIPNNDTSSSNPIENSGHDDELEQIIRNPEELPPADIARFLDDDAESEFGGSGSGSHSDEDSISEAEDKPKRSSGSPSRKGGNRGWNPRGFQCMEKHELKKTGGPNSRTIEILNEMMKHYEATNDHWRTISYRKAIAALAKRDTLIGTFEEAKAIYGIGDRLAAKIVEIVTTDKLERLEYAKLEPTDQLLKKFMKIYGVGYAKAKTFQAAGYKSLEDLRKNAALSEIQRIGLDHYEDFESRIPRAEVTEHGSIVARAAKAIDPDIQTTVMGSYRRGAADCGDIDIIITKPDATILQLKPFLDKLVDALFAEDFLQAGLAIARHHDGSKWHGASRVGPSTNPWRRIDFLLVPWEEMGAALLYFTGNDIFNRSIRLLASKKGYRLNQRGLYTDVLRGKGREKLTEGTLVEGRSEKRIFEILGVPYRPPEHRNC